MAKKPPQKAASGATKRRGPHAVRSAAMRRKLIDAAIVCLDKYGYGKTTLQKITDEAGVSRGAFLHHFPTRCDLITAVAEDAAVQQNDFVRSTLAKFKPGVELFDAITEATWQALLQPPAIALIEIMMGARSDPELDARFTTTLQKLQDAQREGVWLVAQQVGIRDKQAVLNMVHLHRAAMRGLLIELKYTHDREAAEAGMELLKHYKVLLTKELGGATE
ncbi:MAG: TetR/AcrR family transcriptional regulator [Alphaproteobacteria bacterium]|nr:TetR/AcrR family transcriptional regulator [Alphaproteobacteria bacterium]|tara:strand:+ start:3512 stop:4171 length:660 start_codon:yes stop_codon:yes gene_type:complete